MQGHTATMPSGETDQERFDRIYEAYHPVMRAYASYLLRDYPSLVDDAIQAAFIRIARNIRILDDVDAVATEIYAKKCVKLAMLDMLKKERIQLFSPLEEHYDLPSTDYPVLDHWSDRDYVYTLEAYGEAADPVQMVALARDVIN